MSCLVTIESFRAYSGISVISEDSKITGIIEGVSDMVSRYCHRDFGFNAFDENFDIWDFDEDTIHVRNYPIVSVVGLTDDGNLVDPTNYKVYKKEGIISLKERTYVSQYYRRDHFFTKGHQTVEVSYWGGHELIPDSLQLAVKMVSNRIYNDVGSEEMLSEKIGGYSYTKKILNPDEFFTPTERLLLNIHRKII